MSLAGLASRPASPISPTVKRDVVLGAIVGLLLGLALAFGLERLDPRIRDPKALEAAYEVPLLAAVPKRREYKVMRSLGSWRNAGRGSPQYDEVFNLLRSYIRYLSVDRQLQTLGLDSSSNSLLVISADRGEGKTTVAYNLAKAAAQVGSRVLLIESDLRSGTAIEPLLATPQPTIYDVLTGRASMREAVVSAPVGRQGVLDVIVAGDAAPGEAGELIEGPAMESLLNQARAAYELVVVDTPPLGLVADAVPLLTQVDGVIVVGRIGVSRLGAAAKLHEQLTGLRAPVLGVVANMVRGEEATTYGRRKAYRSGSREAVEAGPANGSRWANGNPSSDAAGAKTSAKRD